jgi:hypothetical protein
VVGGKDLSCEMGMSNQTDCSMIWTVYRYPNDYPGHWVMRGHEILPGIGVRPHSVCFVAKTLDEIRTKVPPGTWRVDREPNDNPVIYETWLGETSTPSSQ